MFSFKLRMPFNSEVLLHTAKQRSPRPLASARLHRWHQVLLRIITSENPTAPQLRRPSKSVRCWPSKFLVTVTNHVDEDFSLAAEAKTSSKVAYLKWSVGISCIDHSGKNHRSCSWGTHMVFFMSLTGFTEMHVYIDQTRSYNRAWTSRTSCPSVWEGFQRSLQFFFRFNAKDTELDRPVLGSITRPFF